MAQLVLIVDDNSDNRRIYASMLQHLGYRVVEAADGESGVEAARTEHPDAILMDMGLPGRLDGWAATRTLKDDPDTAGIPILALTAHAQPEHEKRAREAGCDAYLAKPAEPRAVAAEVRRLIEAGPRG